MVTWQTFIFACRLVDKLSLIHKNLIHFFGKYTITDNINNNKMQQNDCPSRPLQTTVSRDTITKCLL